MHSELAQSLNLLFKKTLPILQIFTTLAKTTNESLWKKWSKSGPESTHWEALS